MIKNKKNICVKSANNQIKKLMQGVTCLIGETRRRVAVDQQSRHSKEKG
jgi:hypothetical protein